MSALWLAVLSASLLGSLHCAGMCGGLVAFYAGGGGTRSRWRDHAAYHAGRLAMYAALGALAGALGAAIDATGTLVGIGRVAAVATGALIVLWGAVALCESLGARVPGAGAATALAHGLARRLAPSAAAVPARLRALVGGVLTGLLPCGWLYAFVATAAGTGRADLGALTMAVFWLGTLPALVGLGFGVALLSAPLRRRLPAACAVAMIVVGLVSVAMRVAPHSPPAHHAPAGQAHGHR